MEVERVSLTQLRIFHQEFLLLGLEFSVIMEAIRTSTVSFLTALLAIMCGAILAQMYFTVFYIFRTSQENREKAHESSS